MKGRLLDTSVFNDPAVAVEFLGNLLEASIAYSMIGTDLEGTILVWNEGARRLYGYETSEAIGRSKQDLHTPEDVAAGLPQEMIDGALTHGKWEGTVARQRKDGSRFTARVVITPRRDSAGGVATGFLLISKDISEEVRLTAELEETQLYTRSLIESNVDALMTTDPLGVITDVNQQMEQLTGASREVLIGTPFKAYFTEPDKAEDGIRLTLRQSKVTNYELTARARDGTQTVVSYNASTFNDAEGRLQGVFAAARDITEQKRLEEQLRQSESYNRGLIEASVDGLITVSPDGDIMDVNEQMCRLSGFDREELIGSAFAEYFADADRASAGVAATFSEGVVTDYVLTLRPRAGSDIRVSFNASVFKDDAGDVRGIFASARDITERAMLQAQLADERAYNRGLIEASVDGLITVDPMLTITDVNETMCQLSGYAREELIGSPFQSYFTDGSRAAHGVRQTLDEGSVTNYELTLRARDGRERLVSFNAAIFKNEANAVRGIFASARDITEQAGLQNQLADERAYNRGLIEASVDGLVTVNENLVITDVNEQLCRMTGRSRAHLVDTPFPTYFVEHDLAADGVRLTFEQGMVTDYVLTLQAAGGAEVPVSFNAGVFSDASGVRQGILAAAREITAQKELEQRLTDQQSYTRSLIESNVDALMTTDPLGVITDVNQQMEQLTGASREVLIGTPFKAYFTEPDKAEDGIRLTLRQSKVTNYELTARARDGTQTVVSYNASTFNDAEGRLQGVFAAARDITERKRFEEQLQRTNLELENASFAKDRFLASMSHELRTPLNSILGFSGTLLMGLAGPLNGEQRKQLSTIEVNGRHLLSIINDLLDLAKIESGKVELRFEPVACGELLREVVDGLRPLADEKGLALELETPPDAVVLNTDRRSLTQILINLASNAIKFTDAGSVVVRLEHGRSDGVQVTRLHIVDTGPGIEPADQEKLFKAFERIEGSHSRRFEGTGLGLYISDKLAGLIHGAITFDSRPGQGSTFTLELPQ